MRLRLSGGVSAFSSELSGGLHVARGYLFRLVPGQYVDRHIFIEGLYERRFLELIRKCFHGGIAIDIGANIGNHTIFLSATFTQIHCFEPNPVALERLKDHISLNRITNVSVHSFGLSDRDMQLPFHQNNDGNLGASGFVEREDDCTLYLEVRRGDEYIDGLGLQRIDFMKVDVEGHEPAVLLGLRRTISRFRPVLAFEFHSHMASSGDFATISKCMPGYIFAEARHAPADASLMDKLRWNYAHQGVPILNRVITPEPRTYENILAFPDEETFARFISS